MSFSKNRKQSGMILTGVVLSSSIVSAANHGFVGAVPQSEVSRTLKNFAGKGAENSNYTVVNFLKNNWGWVLVALGLITVAGLIFYKIKNQGLGFNEMKNTYEKNEKGNKNTNREVDEYGMVSLFCEEESGPFAKIIKKPLTLLNDYFNKELLGIEGTKIEMTVEDLLKILKDNSKEEFTKAMEKNPKQKVNIEIKAVNEDGNLDICVESLDLGDLETKYINPDNIDGLIGFFNKVFKKASDDSKKDYRFELKKGNEDNVSINLIENRENGKQVGSSLAIELEEVEGEEKDGIFAVKKEKDLNSLILKYQNEEKKIDIFDELFFESENDDDDYGEFYFNFGEDLKFIDGLEVEVSSDTLLRILDEGSYNDLADEIEDYLNENENIKIVFSAGDKYFLRFGLYNKDTNNCFDYCLETRMADNNVGKFIKFYNYILDEAYKQKKMAFKVSLEQKEDKKIVVKYGTDEFELRSDNRFNDILSCIENKNKKQDSKDIDEDDDIGFGAIFDD